MAFIKGQSGNPNGRPRGAKNKATEDLREWLSKLISDNRATMEQDLQELLPQERLRFFLALMNYAVPKMQSISAKVEDERDRGGINLIVDQETADILNELAARGG